MSICRRFYKEPKTSDDVEEMLEAQAGPATSNEKEVSAATIDEVVTETQELTSFDDAAPRVTDSKDVAPNRSETSNPYITEDIIQWISRPMLVKQFDWVAGTPSGHRIAALRFPYELFQNSTIQAKMKNFKYFRAGIKISIRVNGTRFHYGKLLFMWSPQSNATGDLFKATDSLMCASSFPHVLVSPTENEVHEFEMPYSIPSEYIDLVGYGYKHQEFNIGNVYVYVMNSLAVAGASVVPDVQVSVYANFVNPQLAGYTDAPHNFIVTDTIPDQTEIVNHQTVSYRLAAQMFVPLVPAIVEAGVEAGTAVATYMGMGAAETLVAGSVAEAAVGMEGPIAAATVSNMMLAGAPSGSMPIIAEDEVLHHLEAQSEMTQKTERGLISGVAETISTIAGALEPYSLMSPLMSVIKRGSRTISNVARGLGYCYPLSQESTSRVKLNQPMLSHVAGLDNAVVLAARPDACVSPCYDFMGSSAQEMDLGYVCGTPSLLNIFEWRASNVGKLGQIIVTPSLCGSYSHTSKYRAIYPTMLSYVSRNFVYWRGSINYYFNITCSAFHSGRMMVLYDPHGGSGVATSDNVISKVVDIQDDTEFSFSVPYLQGNTWQRTGTLEGENGILQLRVLNRLTAPSAPIGDIHINVYISAGADFQLGMLKNIQRHESLPIPYPVFIDKPTKTYYGNVVSNEESRKDVRKYGWATDNVIVPQLSYYEEIAEKEAASKTDNQNDEEMLEAQWQTREGIRNMPYKPIIDAHGSIDRGVCMSDHIDSVREMIKRPGQVAQVDSTERKVDLEINPFAPFNQWDFNTTGHLSYMKMIYRYSRGSMIVKVLPSMKTVKDLEGSHMASVYINEPEDWLHSHFMHQMVISGDAWDQSHLGEGAVVSGDLRVQPLEVAIPYYAKNSAYVNGVGSFVKNNNLETKVTVQCTAKRYTVMLSAGDDYELGFLVGPPRLMSKTA